MFLSFKGSNFDYRTLELWNFGTLELWKSQTHKSG